MTKLPKLGTTCRISSKLGLLEHQLSPHSIYYNSPAVSYTPPIKSDCAPRRSRSAYQPCGIHDFCCRTSQWHCTHCARSINKRVEVVHVLIGPCLLRSCAALTNTRTSLASPSATARRHRSICRRASTMAPASSGTRRKMPTTSSSPFLAPAPTRRVTTTESSSCVGAPHCQ